MNLVGKVNRVLLDEMDNLVREGYKEPQVVRAYQEAMVHRGQLVRKVHEGIEENKGELVLMAKLAIVVRREHKVHREGLGQGEIKENEDKKVSKDLQVH